MPEIGHTGWQVQSIDPAAYVTTRTGDTQYGARVRFATGAGNQGSVFIANDQLNPAVVGAAIDVQAALLDSIATLTSEPRMVEV